jgi:hypothetical protein
MTPIALKPVLNLHFTTRQYFISKLLKELFFPRALYALDGLSTSVV